MKQTTILILAATPPPHHGQSYMTSLLVEHLADEHLQVLHVNAAVSRSLDDLGCWGPVKILRAILIWLRAFTLVLTKRPDVLYYVPATGERTQVWRDWLLFGTLRPLVSRTVLHWHGIGLKSLFDTKLTGWERWLTRRVLGRTSLSIILAEFQRPEVEWLMPEQIAVIPNGVPVPLGGAGYIQHSGTKSDGIRVFRVLFMGHCTREKGLFDALDAIALTNSTLETQSAIENRKSHARRATPSTAEQENAYLRGVGYKSKIHIVLDVCGHFMSEEEKQEFENRISQPDLQLPFDNRNSIENSNASRWLGFISGAEKERLLSESDCLVFPSYFRTEVQPVAVIEALGRGLPVVVSDWRGLPEMVEGTGLPVVPVRDPHALAEALLRVMEFRDFDALRRVYEARFSLDAHLGAMRAVLKGSGVIKDAK